MKFAYEDLSDDQFESLVVLVCQRLLGISVQGFAKGPDSDLPVRAEESEPVFEADEIIVTLHDEGDNGRLFMMKAW